METIISGSRRITDPGIVDRAVLASGFTITKVIEGGQRTYNTEREPIGGVDYLAKLWALRNRLPFRRVDAEWQIHGNAAGPIRNRKMAQEGKQLIAIPDRESTGTLDMIEAAREAGFQPSQIFVYYDPDLFPEKQTLEARLQRITEHPEEHRHSFEDLQACCMVNGSFDPRLMEAHPQLGRNGGRKCDVVSGACSCGAWH